VIVRLSDFQNYAGVRTSGGSDLQTGLLLSAEAVVANFLGYNPVETIYTALLDGDGSPVLRLGARPIRAVTLLETGGVPQNTAEFYPDGQSEFLVRENGVFPEGRRNIKVTYVAGWNNTPHEPPVPDGGDWDGGGADADADYGETVDGGGAFNSEEDGTDMPKIIKLTIMRIAAILQSESDGNIGVTSKSFGESGDRTFVSFTNFDRYLAPLSAYKLLAI
jgi:hypothetical protein